jgi:uncharacterized LabA/DUF88 family protein
MSFKLYYSCMNPSQHKEQKVAIFVDVQNMYYSAKNLYGSKVDFGKVLQTGISGRKLIRAFAYVIRADVGSEKEFFGALNKMGFEVREKDLQVFYDGAKKGDWDVGLCMDVVRMIPKIDVMVLVSGDGDYTDLIEYAQSQGVKAEVIAFGRTLSSKLIEASDLFIDMDKDSQRFLIGSYNGETRKRGSTRTLVKQNVTQGNSQ